MILQYNKTILYNYEIKRKKDILFDFEFSKYENNVYRIKYNLYFDKVEKYFKNDEEGLLIKGYLARVLSKFFNDFKIEPENKEQGFDFSLDIEFEQTISEKNFIDVFKSYEEFLNIILKETKIVLTRDNINVIINYFNNLENKSIEHLIIIDLKDNYVYEVNKNIDIQDERTLGVWLTEKDLEEINNMELPLFIHNHQKSLEFSQNDIETYRKLKSVINKKILFMIYSMENQELKEINTGTIFS